MLPIVNLSIFIVFFYKQEVVYWCGEDNRIIESCVGSFMTPDTCHGAFLQIK